MKNNINSNLQAISLSASIAALATLAAFSSPSKVAMFNTIGGIKTLARGLVLSNGMLNLFFFLFINKEIKEPIISEKSFATIKMYYYTNTVFLGLFLVLISMPSVTSQTLYWVEYIFPAVAAWNTVSLYKLFKK